MSLNTKKNLPPMHQESKNIEIAKKDRSIDLQKYPNKKIKKEKKIGSVWN